MNKIFIALINPFICSAFAFEKLDSKYLIPYGNPKSEIQIFEYFSLSCPKCFDFFQEQFPRLRKKYLDTGEVSWCFHPDPADLLTLQAMVCLEALPDAKKPIFLEAVLKHIQEKNFKHGCIILQAAMEVLGHPLPLLAEAEFLEKTQAFNNAFQFLKQKDVVKTIPTVEINGRLHETYPTFEFLDAAITVLKGKKV